MPNQECLLHNAIMLARDSLDAISSAFTDVAADTDGGRLLEHKISALAIQQQAFASAAQQVVNQASSYITQMDQADQTDRAPADD